MDLVLNSSGLVSVVETVALPIVWAFRIYELYSGVQGAGSWKKVSKSMTNLTSEVFQAEKLCTTEQSGPLHPWPPALSLEWDFQVSHWERLGSLSVEAQLWGRPTEQMAPGGAQALRFTGHYTPTLVEKCSHKLGLVVHACKTRQEGHCEWEVSLVYTVS